MTGSHVGSKRRDRNKKNILELYGEDQGKWDLAEYSEMWLREYQAENPFAKREEDDITPTSLHEFALLSGRGSEDGEITSVVVMGVRASDVLPEECQWLWPDRIAHGKICWFAGKPDCGKSMAMLDVVSRVTTGTDWPDGKRNTWGPKNVIMALSEDGLADTVVPRLVAAGANLERITFLTTLVVEKEGKTNRRPFMLSHDIQHLRNMLKADPECILVALDPITSFFGDVNVNADQEVRPIMDALSKCCVDSGVSFVSVVHQNKRTDVDAIQKILRASSCHRSGSHDVELLQRPRKSRTSS